MDCIIRSRGHPSDESRRECVAAAAYQNNALQQDNILSKSNQKAHSIRGLFASNKLMSKLSIGILDLVFPPMCHGCGRVDTRWCNICLNDLFNVPIHIQDYEPQILSGLCATGHHTGKLQQAIQSLKYNNTPQLAQSLGQRLITVLQQKAWAVDAILPVPLFADRLQKRGYNQAYLLSQPIEKHFNIPVQQDWIQRYRDTNQQVGLNAHERRENVKDAFIASQEVTDKAVLLIDDVVTTGATLDECATALFEVGAKAIYGMTVSHA